MARIVPFLSAKQIERDAAALLAEYAQQRAIAIEAPIPIEDIVEKHLRLRVEFDDTHKRQGIPRLGHDPDILGMIWFDERCIVIDETLDPDEYPAREGRYRFTLAHEGGGHWRLHRHLFASASGQLSIFGDPSAPSVVCRISQAREPLEWQADFCASCLLMPAPLIVRAWCERFGDTRPRVLQRTAPLPRAGAAGTGSASVIRTLDPELADDAMRELVHPFARKFLVSMEAMRIRLEQVGLLQRAIPDQQSLTIDT